MVAGLSACSGAFWSGAGGGTLAAGAGYEYNAKVQEDRIKKDLGEGKITQSEYDIRKSQIERMSIIRQPKGQAGLSLSRADLVQKHWFLPKVPGFERRPRAGFMELRPYGSSDFIRVAGGPTGTGISE